MALIGSPLGPLLAKHMELLLRIVGNIPEDDAFVVQLACEAMHAAMQERFWWTGGVKTTSKGVTSSLTRFDLVWNWPEESRPDWLRMSSPSWEEEHASTALHRACFVGHEVLVRLLLHHHGANVDVESVASHALIMASTMTVVRTAVGNEGHTVLMPQRSRGGREASG